MARCSGRIPVLLAATGPVVSGPALLLGLADQVVMTEDAYAFVSGPRMVETFTGRVARQRWSSAGAGIHASNTGVAALVVPDAAAALEALSDILAYLPSVIDEEPPRWWTDDPVDRPTPEAGDCIPASPTGGYDVRDVARSIVDDGDLLELRAHWAPNLVTGLATIGGRPVGIVANQPLSIAGTLDIPASQKGARFVVVLRRLRPPAAHPRRHARLLPGQGPRVARDDPPRRPAGLRLRPGDVPRVAVVLRKAYGGAYIVMDCRSMGSDLYLAWPSAEIAVMGAKGAVEILHRRESPERRARARGRVRGALPQPVRGRRPGLRRRRHRSRRHPARGGRRLRGARHQARDPGEPQARQLARCRS